MTKKEAFEIVEFLLVGRLKKFDTAINALCDLDIDVTETMEQMREEREALRIMRNAAMIATRGERAEIAPDMEPGFTVPLYLHPPAEQPSLQQDLEGWIDENEFRDSWGINAVYTGDLRAFLAGKVLVPVNELNDVLEMASLALSMTPIGSRERKSFRAVADAIK